MSRVTILLVALASAFASGAAEALFTRWPSNPLFAVAPAIKWRSIHVANAAVLTPAENPDGRWRLFLRGSGRFPEEGNDPNRNYHDSIGLFTQEAADFSPFKWKESPNNPVITHGPDNSYDELNLLDCTPVWGKTRDGKADVLYLYYKGLMRNHRSCLAGAWSTNGGLSFTKFDTNPLQKDVGPSDAVFHQGAYYLFYGDAKYNAARKRTTDRLKIYVAVTQQPDDLSHAERHLAIDVGPNGAFDSRSVNGGRIFRLRDKWFIIYQGSAVHFDYPNRFNAAYSSDLIHWTKVTNAQPLFERGAQGQWDQGAIWFGEAFEHNGTLYLLYEGWGWPGNKFDRTVPYAKPGRSQTGLASVSVKAFLTWCGFQN